MLNPDRPHALPLEPLPPYAFVPGGPWPHPVRDPRGHSYRGAQAASLPQSLNTGNWANSAEYLRGFALFNHGFYWEAHEVWESLWHASGRSGPVADLLKALIKLAAAGVKVREAQPHGVATHAGRSAQILAQLQNSLHASEFLGLNLPELISRCQSLVQQPKLSPGPWHAAVVRVFPWRIFPCDQNAVANQPDQIPSS